MEAPELCVSAIVIDDERLLLVRRGRGRAQGDWAVPGGRVQAGEMLAEAVVRELVGETGIEGVCGNLLVCLNVKLILGLTSLAVFGTWCCQKLLVVPPIKRNEP